MAEAVATWRSPLATTDPAPSSKHVRLLALPRMARLSVRGNEQAADVMALSFGVPLPRAACRAETKGNRAALWLGPDEWLLLAPVEDGDGIQAFLVNALGEDVVASVVDVSERSVAIAVEGPRAADVLNAFCALDLALASFPIGMCTRTLVGRAEVVLWRTTVAGFHLDIWRSFAPYVWDCLKEACIEFAEGDANQ